MMWKIRITIINGQTLKPKKIRQRNPARKVDMVLVHCNNAHYIPLCESFPLSSLILVLNMSLSRCIMTYIYSVTTSSNDVATSPFCVMCSCVPPCFMLSVQEYNAEDGEGNITRMWSVLKVRLLESNPGFSLRQEDPEVYSDGGEDNGDGWVCRRAWLHIQIMSRPVRPQASQVRVEVPTLPQRVKKDLLEQHHHLCKLMSTLNMDPCKEYRYSCTPAVLSRVRQGNRACTICNKVCSTTQNL